MEQRSYPLNKIEDDNLPDIIPEPLNITNINDYCKIRIFEYSEADDLLNVVEANKQLQVAARDVFERKYSDGRLDLNSMWSMLYQQDLNRGPTMEFNRSKTLALLRNFGHLISNMTIHYQKGFCYDSNHLKFLHDLEWYLIEYCSKSVKKITIEGITLKDTTTFRTKGVQLPNVTKVQYKHSEFSKNFSFSENFPNLQALSLDGHYCHFNIKDWQFPNVKHLYFHNLGWQPEPYMYNGKEYFAYDKKVDYNNGIYFIEMLKHNQQLEKLELEYYRDYDWEADHFYQFIPNVLKCLNEYFPALHCLHLAFDEYYAVNISEEVFLENVTNFSLTTWNIQVFQNMPFKFQRLERFRFDALAFAYDFRDKLSAIPKFISQNKYLKVIDVNSLAPCEVSQILQLENVLSNVEELSICARRHPHLSSDAVENFLARSQSIKSFKICGIDNISDGLKSKICEKMPHWPTVREEMDPELVFGQVNSANNSFPLKKCFRN